MTFLLKLSHFWLFTIKNTYTCDTGIIPCILQVNKLRHWEAKLVTQSISDRSRVKLRSSDLKPKDISSNCCVN